MFIQTLLPPVAGELFRFSVSGCAGKTNVVVYVHDRRILHRELNELLSKLAVMVHDVYSAERARKSNNAQIMTMGRGSFALKLQKRSSVPGLTLSSREGDRFPKLRKSWNMTGNSGTQPPDKKH
jgi:hypothetical protein